MMLDTLTIVGVGLIGGSVALAAKRARLAARVIGCGRSAQTLILACERGVIDEAQTRIGDAVARADFVVVCTPVDQIAGHLIEASRSCSSQCILTDAGSTKAELVREVEAATTPRTLFVGSHPLAGSEKTGWQFADARLFENRRTVLTPTPRTMARAVETAKSFWEALGCKVSLLSPSQHDEAMALTSHLPHVLASVLAGLLPDELRPFAASGFRDTTRIAAGDPDLWSAILMQNREAMIEACRLAGQRLREWEHAIEKRDKTSLHHLLTQAKKVRDALGN